MELEERTGNLVSLTPSAAAKIRVLMEEDTDVSVLRVAIEGGGCSGFQYGLGFDRGAQEGDVEFAFFIVILLVAYVYIWRKGALEW